jgi:uncharacterized protein (DUF302 family)
LKNRGHKERPPHLRGGSHMGMEADHGIERVNSPRGFGDTVAHLEGLLAAQGLTLFAKIDFSGDAKKAGLEMLPTQMLIFGNPKGGTPVMMAAPSSALDLPLKVLISQDPQGKVWMSFNAPEYLGERHAIPAVLVKNIAGIRSLVQAAAK